MYNIKVYFEVLLTLKWKHLNTRGVWRYQRGNHNPYIKEEQTTSALNIHSE